jgi:hypothetical protein
MKDVDGDTDEETDGETDEETGGETELDGVDDSVA